MAEREQRPSEPLLFLGLAALVLLFFLGCGLTARNERPPGSAAYPNKRARSLNATKQTPKPRMLWESNRWLPDNESRQLPVAFSPDGKEVITTYPAVLDAETGRTIWQGPSPPNRSTKESEKTGSGQAPWATASKILTLDLDYDSDGDGWGDVKRLRRLWPEPVRDFGPLTVEAKNIEVNLTGDRLYLVEEFLDGNTNYRLHVYSTDRLRKIGSQTYRRMSLWRHSFAYEPLLVFQQDVSVGFPKAGRVISLTRNAEPVTDVQWPMSDRGGEWDSELVSFDPTGRWLVFRERAVIRVAGKRNPQYGNPQLMLYNTQKSSVSWTRPLTSIDVDQVKESKHPGLSPRGYPPDWQDRVNPYVLPTDNGKVVLCPNGTVVTESKSSDSNIGVQGEDQEVKWVLGLNDYLLVAESALFTSDLGRRWDIESLLTHGEPSAVSPDGDLIIVLRRSQPQSWTNRGAWIAMSVWRLN